MLRRSRSQSSSPALPRRHPQDIAVLAGAGAGAGVQGVVGVTDKTTEGGEGSGSGGGGGSEGSTGSSSSSSDSKNALNRSTDSEETRGRALASAPQKEPPSPGTSGFPPLPHSPSPVRRDLFKVSGKETAPSIRMMIAKYNQKLSAAESGGRSPEVTGSGHSSPVAWRSPVAERRVRAQSEKYQQEVQKSASAGVIRGGGCPPSPSPADRSPRLGPPRGILKSSSAGAIQPQVLAARDTASIPDKEGEEPRASSGRRAGCDASAPSSPEVGGSTTCPTCPTCPGSPESPLPGRLRALRLRKAKEEFLTRGPGGRSWASDVSPSSPSPPTSPPTSPLPEPFRGPNGGNRLSQVSVGSESSVDCALDQLLVKSASAGALTTDRFERALPLHQPGGSLPRSRPEPRPSSDEAGPSRASPAPSSASKQSSGSKFGISSIASRFRKVKMRRGKEKEAPRMATVSQLCRQSLLVDLHLSKGCADEPSAASLPSAAAGAAAAAAGAPTATAPAGPQIAPAPSSKSCPSSPVLQRPSPSPSPAPRETRPRSAQQPPLARPEDTAAATPFWMRNPARRIFKPK